MMEPQDANIPAQVDLLPEIKPRKVCINLPTSHTEPNQVEVQTSQDGIQWTKHNEVTYTDSTISFQTNHPCLKVVDKIVGQRCDIKNMTLIFTKPKWVSSRQKHAIRLSLFLLEEYNPGFNLLQDFDEKCYYMASIKLRRCSQLLITLNVEQDPELESKFKIHPEVNEINDAFDSPMNQIMITINEVPPSHKNEICTTLRYLVKDGDEIRKHHCFEVESDLDNQPASQEGHQSPRISMQSRDHGQQAGNDIYNINYYAPFTPWVNEETLKVGGCKVKFPQNALNRPTQLNFRSHPRDVGQSDTMTPTLECLPHGLKFDKPIEITLPTCYITEGSTPVKVMTSENGKTWTEHDEVIYENDSEIRFETEHFSFFKVICENFLQMKILKQKSLIFTKPQWVNNSRKNAIRLSLILVDFCPGIDHLKGSDEKVYNMETLKLRKCDKIIVKLKVKQDPDLKSEFKLDCESHELEDAFDSPWNQIFLNISEEPVSNKNKISTILEYFVIDDKDEKLTQNYILLDSGEPPIPNMSKTSGLTEPRKIRFRNLEELFHAFDGYKLALDLQTRYVTLLRENKYKEANQVASALRLMFHGQLNTTLNELLQLGIKLREEKKYLESILVFQISLIIFANDRDPKKAVVNVELCAEEFKKSNIEMIESDVTMKPIVRDHVLPLIRDIRLQIVETKNIDEKFRVLSLVWCLHYIEMSEGLIGDRKSRERSLKKAISLMETTFGVEASKHLIYAQCLNNLGVMCVENMQITDAVKYYERALEAWKKAEDHPSEKKKKELIEITENNLRMYKANLY